MRWIYIFLLCTVPGCKEHTSHATAVQQTDLHNPLPLSAGNYLEIHLPGWNMIEASDYDKSWWSFYDPQQTPWLVITDINDDQLADYALLLKKSDSLRLVILLGSGKQTFTHQIADDFHPVYSGKVKDVQFGLLVEPPAQVDVVYPEERSLILTSNGITLMELEVRSRIYYWKDGIIKTFYAK